MALLDKVFGKNDQNGALKQEIQSLELRKKSVLSTIDAEIAGLQKERSNVLFEAGCKAFDTWKEEGTQADLSDYWKKVQQFDGLIAEQEAKRLEMGSRYDEEIQLMRKNLSLSEGASHAKSVKICPSCKAEAEPDADFCQNCGTRL